MGDVSGQQPKRSEPLPAPLLPAEQAWNRALPDLPAATGALDAERVYIPLQTDGIVALARESGEPAWTAPVTTQWPLVLAPQSVIAVTGREVTSIDRTTGAVRWRAALPGDALAGGTVAADLIVVPLADTSLHALRVSDGGNAWNVRLAGLAAPVALAAGADAVYLTMDGSRAVAVARATGQVMWDVRLEGTLSPPTAAGDRVFIGSTTNAFYALNARSGQPEWTWGAGMVGGDIIGSAVDREITFFLGLDNLLRAVNTDNGNQRWKQPTPTRPTAPPQAFGGIVAVFGVSPAMATFNAKTGAPIATLVIPTVTGATTAPVPKGPPLIDPELRPFRVGFVVVTGDGRAFGMRPTGMLFRDPPTVPFAELPGRTLQPESLPARPTVP